MSGLQRHYIKIEKGDLVEIQCLSYLWAIISPVLLLLSIDIWQINICHFIVFIQPTNVKNL